MRKYHSIESARVRNKRKKFARDYVQVSQEELDKINCDSEQVWLGSCGVKHCQLCSWRRYESKTRHQLCHTDKIAKQSARQEEEDYWGGWTQDFVIGHYPPDSDTYGWSEEDIEWHNNYLKKRAA